MVEIIIDSQYYRNQFDDWLAGEKAKYKKKTYYQDAYNSNNGFGWEIEPICKEHWDNIIEDKFTRIVNLIENCLYNNKKKTYIINS